ncbi:hypothetical protein K503DRAFT_95332 [Rhizopogon vinicolor AM-OR11-026]|uniref:DUF6593 domain-containing protein n=1 Tax=Rhizopogon vinicolor AM-OR11-026 TaxID=1314800 RepID=A0A1B7MFH9_9AGAM|nr:hypothetical protein K503DRAFT_95332 [Rhizopogon vinicolor AM-OR11-026]
MGVLRVKSFSTDTIRFTLSSENVRNTVITNERGQIIYKTDTPFRFCTRITTIYKIKPNTGWSRRDQFDVVGEIEWHKLTSSRFHFGGTEVATKKFIPSRGFTGRKRIFTGPDGHSYRWDLKSNIVVKNWSQTELARSHRKTLGIIGRKRKAMLEVSPEVAHMMDTVIMTFIYVEKLRMDKEEAANNAAVG